MISSNHTRVIINYINSRLIKSIASFELNPMRIGTLLKRPSFKIVKGSSVKKGLSCSASESFVGFKSFSIDGTNAKPTFFRASSTVSVFGAASTICCGELFFRNSARKNHQFCQSRSSSMTYALSFQCY